MTRDDRVIHGPTDSSQKKIGIVAMPVQADCGSLMPAIAADAAELEAALERLG